MKVGWLADDPGYVGGAERTQAEFRSAAPKGVEVVSCPAGHVVSELDVYVIHNCTTYSDQDLRALGDAAPVVRYHHDIAPRFLDAFFNLRRVTHVFTSPLHRERMKMEGECIPPAINLELIRQVGQGHKLMVGERKGAIWLGMHPNHPGKGVDLALEWASGNGGLDIYGNQAPNGGVRYEDVPRLLARYKTFVHLPRALEPFGRTVVEAWAAGCELVLNRKVGAKYWIEENQRGLQTASRDFWRAVLS